MIQAKGTSDRVCLLCNVMRRGPSTKSMGGVLMTLVMRNALMTPRHEEGPVDEVDGRSPDDPRHEEGPVDEGDGRSPDDPRHEEGPVVFLYCFF